MMDVPQFIELQSPPAPFQIDLNETDISKLFAEHKYIEVVHQTAIQIPDNLADVELALSMYYMRILSLLQLKLGSNVVKEARTNLQQLKIPEFMLNLPVKAQITTWKIELITAPITANGINDKAISIYYNLANDARTKARATEDSDMKAQWLEVLPMVETYIVSALIILKDYNCALGLLEQSFNKDKFRLCALISLLVGDLIGFDKFVNQVQDQDTKARLLKLLNSDSGLAKVYAGDVSTGIDSLESSLMEFNNHLNPFTLRNLLTLYSMFNPQRKADLLEKFKASSKPVSIENMELLNALM